MKIELKPPLYFSPIGDGKKVHVFKGDSCRALCLKGPPLTIWRNDTDEEDICRVCLRRMKE